MKSKPRLSRILTLFISLLVAILALVTFMNMETSAATLPLANAAPSGSGIVIEPKGATGSEIYLIRLADPPLAAYKGGIAGLAATSLAAVGERKLDVRSQTSLAYSQYLENQQDSIITEMENLLGRSVEVVYRYSTANNGLAIPMTPEEAAQVVQMSGVTFVQRDFERELQSDVGPAWIGAPSVWDGSTSGGIGTMGEGIVVGVIDTGINFANPSFAAVGPTDNYTHTNPLGTGVYIGWCATNAGCNDKLIGAWGYPTVNGGNPTDYDGHGSHTASIAAGNFVTATVNAPTLTISPTISGIAPHANIIAYAACCTVSALSAAIDQTITDGVDVVNYSISSSGSSNLWSDFDTVGFLNARAAGIFVATAAGDNGSGDGTVGSPAEAPWLTSVGANTHNRRYGNDITNMSGGDTTPPADIQGTGLTVGYGPAPIVYAGDFGDAQCLNPFAGGTWTNGEIVICDWGTISGTQKGANVLAGGAGGFILANTAAQGESTDSEPHVLPAVHIGYSDAQLLQAWVQDGGAGHMATISGYYLSLDPANGDIMADFSSRGVNRAVSDIIVPSIVAPGVDVLAAYGQNNAVEWDYLSGTSMASPHVAGAAALIMAVHPNWTPAEVQSALMTTAWTNVLDDDGVTAANPFDRGSGRVDLNMAARAGLVLSEEIQNYWDADPSIGGDPKTLNLASMGNASCLVSCSWTRTVSSTQSIPITWTATADAWLTVEPSTFVLPSYGSQVITVTADASLIAANGWTFGEVTLTPTVETFTFTASSNPAVNIPDNGYNGNLGSMASDTIDASAILAGQQVFDVEVELGIDHTWIGDLTVKMLSPKGTVLALMERVEGGATNPPGDNGAGCCGDNSNMSAAAPIRFNDAFAVDPETMGTTINSSGIVCQDDGICNYFPNPDQALATGSVANFAALTGENPSGDWLLYVGDSVASDTGTFQSWAITVTYGADAPPARFPVAVALPPAIEVNPSIITGTQAGGTLVTHTLTISNSGGSDLNWSIFEGTSSICDVTDDIPWVNVVPVSGTTATLSTSMVDVVFDTTGLATGGYTGTLCVSSNDPLIPLLPVTTTVVVPEYMIYLPFMIKP